MVSKFVEEAKSFDEATAVICISHMALMKRFNFQTSFSFVKSFSWLAIVALYLIIGESLTPWRYFVFFFTFINLFMLY